MNPNQYAEQAAAIATLADSIATGRLVGPRHAAVARLVDMVDTLKAWTEDDRSVTLAGIAAEAGVSTMVARVRCDGLMTDHLGYNTPLKPREASLIRAAVVR